MLSVRPSTASRRMAVVVGWCEYFGPFAALAAMACGPSAVPAPRVSPGALTTAAEQSGFVRTGRYDEVQALCAAFLQAYPSRVRCVEFGRTPEDRPMLGLVASDDGTLDPSTARARNRPVLLAQGGIHGGEIDGKDAGFLLLRQLLDGGAAPGVLAKVTFVFVPVFNVDGHERFGPWNRPNQVGPQEMGWRVTAQNLNLNRDYVKTDAPEMRALLKLLLEWDPILYADLHVTDGAKFQHDVSLTVTPTLAGDDALRAQAVSLRDELMRRLAAQGSMPVDFYPDFVKQDDPSSGFAASVSQPRFSPQYWAEHNRLGVLVETHSWKDYATRVRVTRNALLDMLELAAARGAEWLAAARTADEHSARVGGTDVPLEFETDDHVTTIDFQGYAYTRDMSPVSGGPVVRYDDSTPQVWRVPLRDQVRPSLVVQAPRGGYIVPAADAGWVREKLTAHGIESRPLAAALTDGELQVFRATKTSVGPGTFEGRARRTVEGQWKTERRVVPARSLFVPIAQARSHLLMALLEPKASDSLLAWGFFNTAFEPKEYMEPYVAHIVGTGMLKARPDVRAEFERRLREDRAFAASPAARLDFFYQRSPSYDERLNLYPIFRIDLEP